MAGKVYFSRSIYELIKKKVDGNAAPREFLDLEESEATDVVSWAPGALDNLFGGADGKSREGTRILTLINDILRGNVQRWHEAEEITRNVPFTAHIGNVGEYINRKGYPVKIYELFLELASKSRFIESVKWGLALAGPGLRPEDTDVIHIFARYPEFTDCAARALTHGSKTFPSLKKELLVMLPHVWQWGVVNLIEIIIKEKELISDHQVQDAIVIHGMENNCGIPMEIAFTIAQAVDRERIFLHACEDKRYCEALHELMGELLTEPEPLGGIDDLADRDRVLQNYFRLLSLAESDIYLLEGLSNIEHYCTMENCGYQGREELLVSMRELRGKMDYENIVLRALESEKTCWKALTQIRKAPTPVLVEEVCRLFDKTPDNSMLIEILKSSGEAGHLQLLFDAIPKLVNCEERKSYPLAFVTQIGKAHRNNWIYAEIIAALGRLGTAEALQHLHKALKDYDPIVRCAAYRAISSMDLRLADPSWFQKYAFSVREILFMEHEHTLGVALEAALALGVKLTRAEHDRIIEKKKLPEDMADKLRQLME
ncbi:MAG: HEAT repeat domain-containing protein [Vulcanimicrobiota bacterium]